LLFRLFRRLRSVAGLVLPVAIVATLVSCSPERVTLTMLAGSELDDVVGSPPDGDQPFLSRMLKDTGITLQVDKFTGSLSGAETITAGVSYDLAWFASDAYLRVLAPGEPSIIVKPEPIMWSPVVLGVKQSVAKDYGWVNRPVSWREVAEKVTPDGSGFSFAMTDPAASNSGLAALVEASVAMRSGGVAELSEADIQNGVTPLRGLFRGVGLTAGSSGWLSDQYFLGQSNFDGLVNYESEILALNQRPGIQPLHIIHPSDGVVTANYPLILLSRDARKQDAYERLTKWLLGEWAQKQIAKHTRRHRIKDFPGGGPQIVVPSNKRRLDRLLLSYQDRIRKPPRTVYVVDKSASMNDSLTPGSQVTKLDKLKEVFRELASDELATAARFRRLRSRERITILPFSGPVRGQIGRGEDLRAFRPASEQTISEGEAGTADRYRLSGYVEALRAGGATALFDALYESYVRLDQELEAITLEDYTTRWYPTIVLLTDGVQYLGIKRLRFEELWRQTRSRDAVRVFAVHIGPEKVAERCGKPDEPELCRIATLTGGRVFDTSSADLLEVIREIRGYQ
jgi:Ca-activated chloride channel family protein